MLVHDTADNALLAGRLQWLADGGKPSIALHLQDPISNDPYSTALSTLIKGRNDSQIKSMYELFAKVGGLKVLSASFKVHIQVGEHSHISFADAQCCHRKRSRPLSWTLRTTKKWYLAC